MAGNDPLAWNVPIVDAMGRPTPEFLLKWNQQGAINGDIPSLSTPEQVSAVLDVIGSTRGSLLVRSAAGWIILPPGTANRVLTSGGPGADPSWVAPATIQTMLDSISNTQGSILYRAAGGWVALPPGTSGNVLSTNGAGADPSWIAAGGGGGAAQVATAGPASNSASSSTWCFKGMSCIPVTNIKVTAVWGYFTTLVVAGDYQGLVGLLNGTSFTPTLSGAPTISPVAHPPDTARQWFRVPFSAPVALTAGNPYCICIGRTDAGGTHALPISVTGYPSPWLGNWYTLNRLNNVAPGAGASVDTNSGNRDGWGMGVEWTT